MRCTVETVQRTSRGFSEKSSDIVLISCAFRYFRIMAAKVSYCGMF